MDELVQKDGLFASLAGTVTDAIMEYFPKEDICRLYLLAGKEVKDAAKTAEMRGLLYQKVDENSILTLNHMFADIDRRENNGSYDIKIANIYGDSNKPVWINCAISYQKEKDSYFVFVKKIDDRMNENQKLFDAARKDPLTKLFNKTYSNREIQNAMSRSDCGALFIIDVDNFKSVNDNMGHLFGDEVIVSVANGIRSTFRSKDIVGRIGGDEFVVYIENLADKNVIQKKAGQICNAVSNIYTGENAMVNISASVGIALYPENAKDFKTLFMNADHALYYTKNMGKNGYSFYDKNNEKMRNNHRTKTAIAEMTDEINEEMDAFYFELNDLAFRLLEETKDVDSSINLMLHRIQDKFSFSAIRIWETTGENKTMKCAYEITDGTSAKIGQENEYSESEWILFNNICNGEPYVYLCSNTHGEGNEIFRSDEKVKSGIIVSVNNNNCFTGAIMFEDDMRERKITGKELKVLKSFERMFAVYKVRQISNENYNNYIERIAERDSLTGLQKYDRFLNRLEENLYVMGEKEKILYIQADIAHFKFVNETYGYDVGDKILQKFARILCASSEYLIGASRAHSDNVVAVYHFPASVSDERMIECVNVKLKGLNAELGRVVDSETFYTNCGICIMPGSDHQYQKGITNAGYAKKLAKEQGERECVCFDNEMMEQHIRELRLLEEFPQALRVGRFQVYYQPQIDTISKTVVGAEALSRWSREDGTLMLPDDFIGILEKSNKITELDFYVIEKVCQFIRKQKEEGNRQIPISVNLSQKHLKSQDFFERLDKLMAKYEVEPTAILFEINEEIFVNEMEDTVAFCNKLNAKGIEVMMDTFGAGYSSLNMLDKLPVSCIKIDRFFIKSNAFEKNQEVILNGIIDIAKKLHKSIASMGVETFEQNTFLCRCGCDIIQGNFYSEPILEDELVEYIKQHSESEVRFAHFRFDGNLEANSEEYSASMNGLALRFNDEILPGRKVLEFPGGAVAHELVELSLGNLTRYDFTISIWFIERKMNMWSSLFYEDFDNALFSIIPKGWDSISSMVRVFEKDNGEEFYDAVGCEGDFKKWTHIAGAYNAVTHSLALFINGFLVGYKNNVIVLKNPGRACLGGDIYQNSFEGYVADLKVINKVMSAKDMRELYEKEKAEYEDKEMNN